MLEIILNGLVRGACYALVALGYTMVYGILGMINFAHGEVFMIGMFASVFGIGVASVLLPGYLFIALIVGFIVSILIAAGFGYANERIAYRRLRGAHLMAPLTSAIGLSIVLQNFIMLSVTKDKIDFPQAQSRFFLENQWHVCEGLTISYLQLLILGTSLVVMGALFWVIHRTRLGMAMRAVAQDRMMAQLVGVSVNKTITTTFVIGSVLASIAGVMVSMYQGVARFDSGYLMGLKAFTAAVLGGIGNIPGAVLGGFILGVTEDLTSYGVGSDWKNLTTFLILMVVLLVRPRGLLGERTANKV
ncbi:MAG: branched-chain amino acid ABC transporter permease [Verrucomicrobiota bacterium]